MGLFNIFSKKENKADLDKGLEKTKEGVFSKLARAVAGKSKVDEEVLDNLEEILISSDVGVDTTVRIIERIEQRVAADKYMNTAELNAILREEITAMLEENRDAEGALSFEKRNGQPFVVMVVGVNGVGKTTTIAKLAYRARMQGKKVLLAAADTFRAAAVEQLGIWAERTGSGFHSKGQNADPAAVAWEAMDIAIRDQYDILFIDTAGRLHTKSNLMDELHKIREVIARKHPGAPHRSILVVDATTGQNALQQTKIFKEAAGIDELILTKLDGTAKGGVAVAVSMQYGIPITYVGLGEKMEDLRPFNGDDFAKALLEQ